ncbi:MAG TPA: TonB-dependent receptor [Steroidobacteraceae bacterium]|jgi:iron complex outermembrane receptor protein
MKTHDNCPKLSPKGFVISALAAFITPALEPPAAAQQASVTEEAPTGLQEVIVTAQKRAQNSQDIGIALSAVTGDQLAALGAVSASDITKTMPAVVLTQPNGPSSFSLSIRGVTQNDFADHQESPAAVYVDDVYVSQMAGLAFTMFDMDRVEVLRGPQGTLFGRNATGGLANFVTRRPTDDYGGYADLTIGSHNLMHIEGAVNGALWQDIDARFSFQSNHYDPLFHNISGGAPDAENGNDWSIRGQLLFKNVGGGSLLFIARGSREDVHAGSWEEYATNPGANGYDTLLGPNQNAYGTCNGCNASGLTNSGPFVTRDNQAGFARLKTEGVTGKYIADLSGATLTIIADYSGLRKDYQEDSDASPFTVFQFFNGSNVNQQSLEARLNGVQGPLIWTAGLYGLRIDGKYYEGWEGPAFFGAEEFNTPSNPNAAYAALDGAAGPWPYGSFPFYTGAPEAPNGALPATRAPYSLLTKSYAAFGQIEYRLTDLLGFTLGARFTKDQKDYNYTWYPYEYFPQSLTGQTVLLTRPSSAVLNVYEASRSDNLWSGKAQVDFHLAPDFLAYLSYNRGVKGGGFSAPLFPATINDLATLTFRPETLISYEVGFKSEYFNHTLRVNGAAYYYDYHNYQALIYTLGLEQLILNANATHKGTEAEIEWAPTEAWDLGLGVSYVDAMVNNIPGRCCTAQGAPVFGDFVPGNAPRWSGNAMARYTLPVGPGHLALQLDGNYLSRFWFNLGDAPAVEQPAFGIANARINYTPASGRIELGLAVENLANKHYGVMGFDNTSINGLAQVYPGMPRWVKAHINYKF